MKFGFLTIKFHSRILIRKFRTSMTWDTRDISGCIGIFYLKHLDSRFTHYRTIKIFVLCFLWDRNIHAVLVWSICLNTRWSLSKLWITDIWCLLDPLRTRDLPPYPNKEANEEKKQGSVIKWGHTASEHTLLWVIPFLSLNCSYFCPKQWAHRFDSIQWTRAIYK